MKLLENYPLQSLNTFGIKATARYYGIFNSPETLQEFLTLPHYGDFGNSDHLIPEIVDLNSY